MKAKQEQKTKQETKTDKVKIDTSYTGKQRTKRFEMRCSNNFLILVEALIKKYSKDYSSYTKSDLVTKAIKELAKKENLLLIGDDYYI